MKIYTSFKFESSKKQIENEILRLKRDWNKYIEEDKEWNEKYKKYNGAELKSIEKAYGIIVSLEIYNKIREIYDTKELFGLKVGIFKGRNEAQIMMVNKEEFGKFK